MTTRKRGGQPIAPEDRRCKTLPLRVTVAELATVKAMAEAEGYQSVAEWQRSRLGLEA